MYLGQSFESVNSIPFAGRTVTISFYARAGANYSATSGVLGGGLFSGTGTDQNALISYTSSTNAVPISATLTTTWQRFSFTGTIGATVTELAPLFAFTPTGTAGANDWFEITGVQIELGSVATSFSRAGGTIQGELAACQRYYYRAAGGQVYSHIGLGYAYSTTAAIFELKLPVTMRTAPSGTLEYGNVAANLTGAGNITFTTLAYSGSEQSADIATINATGGSGLAQYRTYWLLNNNNIAGFVGVSAEL